MDKPKIFYGYWILLVAFLCLFIPIGCGYFIFSLFIRPLQLDMGWSRAMIMLAFSILLLVTGASSPLAGRLVDRFGPKKIICVGISLICLGLAVLSNTHLLWHFYVGYAIVGMGNAGSSQVAASTLVSNWFDRKRGMAIGIMSTGVGAAGFIFVPLVGNYLIPSYGWRISYLILIAIILCVLLPAVLLIVKTRPSDMGLFPDGTTPNTVEKPGKPSLVQADGLSTKSALVTFSFWLLSISYLAAGFSSVGVVQSQVPHLEDIGFPTTTAVTALSALGMMSAIGKFAFGWLCDRFPAKHVCAFGLGIQAIGIFMFINISNTSSPLFFWCYALIFGFSLGSWLPTMSMLTSKSFGLRAYGSIFGIASFFQCIGVATGPLLAGSIFDNTGSYHTAFIIFLLCYTVSIPTVLLIRKVQNA